jgi:hypothetical protein
MSSSASFARKKFARDYDHARLEFDAKLRRRREVTAKLDAEVDEAYKSLDAILRIIGQSLAELEAAA